MIKLVKREMNLLLFIDTLYKTKHRRALMAELLTLSSNPILAIFIIVIILLLIRKIFTWYWKINRLVKTQELQEEILVDIHKEMIEIRKILESDQHHV